MSEMNPATANTRVAIEFLTLWMEPDWRGAAEHIERVLKDPDGPGAPSIVTRTVQPGPPVGGAARQERGARTAGELQTKAGEILRGLSRDLPE